MHTCGLRKMSAGAARRSVQIERHLSAESVWSGYHREGLRDGISARRQYSDQDSLAVQPAIAGGDDDLFERDRSRLL